MDAAFFAVAAWLFVAWLREAERQASFAGRQAAQVSSNCWCCCSPAPTRRSTRPGRTGRKCLGPRVEGDARRGPLLVRQYGCGACHVVPGISGAQGQVGPPLTQMAEFSSEDTDGAGQPITQVNYWAPVAVRRPQDWLSQLDDFDLGRLVRETYSALNNDSRTLAGIGVRTAFDRASELLGIDPGKTFREKLNDLVTAGFIGANERNDLDDLTDAGGAAAHRGWRPTLQQLNTMLNILEAFLHRNFVLGQEAKELKKKVPPKPRRPNTKK